MKYINKIRKNEKLICIYIVFILVMNKYGHCLEFFFCDVNLLFFLSYFY